MPHLTLQISANGPIVELFVGVSAPRAEALKKANRPVPSPIMIRGLIDTGASCTSLDPSVLSALGIVSTGTTPIHTPSTKLGVPHVAKQYDISVVLPHPMINRTFSAIPVIESELAQLGIHALIGRDILAVCLLTYDGTAQTFTLGF